MRRVIVREAGAEESVLSAADLASADEIFISNARIGLWPIRTLDGRELGVGPVTRRLQARLTTLLESAPDA